jgi:hypothetical protein
MTALLLSAMLSARQAPAAPGAAPLRIVRVFVHTNASVDPAEVRAMRESVIDMRDALASKKKIVAIVDAEDKADVVIDVIDRAVTIPKVVFGGVAPATGPPGSGTPPPARAVHLRVKLIYQGEFVSFSNKNSAIESTGGWKSAAQDIAKQMDKWLTEHQAEIFAGKT